MKLVMKIRWSSSLTPCSNWGEVQIRARLSFTFSSYLAQNFVTGFAKYLLFAIPVKSLRNTVCEMHASCICEGKALT